MNEQTTNEAAETQARPSKAADPFLEELSLVRSLYLRLKDLAPARRREVLTYLAQAFEQEEREKKAALFRVGASSVAPSDRAWAVEKGLTIEGLAAARPEAKDV